MLDKKLHTIKTLLGDPRWIVIQEFADDLKTQWRKASLIKETDADTLKELYLKEGRIQGINQFFQNLIKYAKKDA